MSSRTLVLASLCAATVACDSLGLRREPERLNLDVEAVGADQIILVTSTNWIYTNDPACDPDEQQCQQVLRVLDADSTALDVPLSTSFEFTRDYRYYVEVFPAGGATATVRMTIDIDGKPWYDEARELGPSGENGVQESLQFIYQWREPTL